MSRPSPRGIVLLAVLATATLAGCLDQTDSEAILLIDYDDAHRDGPGTRIAASISFDSDDRPAKALYEAKDIDHPDYFTAHDLLLQWIEETDTQAEWSYFSGLGYALKTLDFVRCDFGQGDECYWQLIHNGEPSPKGMSELRVRDGDQIEWVHTPF